MTLSRLCKALAIAGVVGWLSPVTAPLAKNTCEPANRNAVADAEGKGTACTKPEAKQKALDNIGDTRCTGEHDPKCSAEGCDKGGTKCGVTTTINQGDVKFKEIALEGCKSKKGWEATVSGSRLTCSCRCR